MADNLGMMFGAATGNVNVNRQGSDREQLNIKSIAAGRSDAQAVADGLNGILQSVPQITNTLVNANNTSEAIKAKSDYLGVVESEQYIAGTDTQKADMLDSVRDGLPSMSKSYQDSFINYSSGEYIRKQEGRNKETNIAYYNNIGASQASWLGQDSGEYQQGFGIEDSSPISNEEMGKTPQDYAAYLKSVNPSMNIADIRDAQLHALHQDKLLLLSKAGNTKELLEIQKDIIDMEKPYENNMYTLNQSPTVLAKVNKDKLEVKALTATKIVEFKNQAYNFLAGVEQGGNLELPSKVAPYIDATSDNTFAATKAKVSYEKKYVEATQAVEYNIANPIGERKTFLPDNPTLKAQRQPLVTNELFKAIKQGNFQRFTDIATNEPTMIKEAGDQLTTMMHNAKTSEDYLMVSGLIQNIEATSGGARVTTQLFSKDEYVRFKTIESAIQGRPAGTDVQTIVDWVDGNMDKLNTLKMDPSKNAKMLEYAIKLGTKADAYVTYMAEIMKGNPAIGEKEFKEAAKRFENMIGKDSQDKKIDTSMAPNPADNINVMNKEKVDTHINSMLGNEFTSKVFLPSGVVIGKDNYGGTIKLVNASNVIEKTNSEAITEELEAKALEEAQIRGEEGVVPGVLAGAKKGFTSLFRTVIDNIGSVPGGMADVGGTLIDRFGQHLHDSMTQGQQEWWDTLTEGDKSEIITNELDSKIQEVDTKDALKGVNTLTISEADIQPFNNAIQYNEQLGTKLIKLKDGILEDSIAYKIRDFTKESKVLSGAELKKNTLYGNEAIQKVESIEGPLSNGQKRIVELEAYVDGNYIDTHGILTSGVGQTKGYRSKSFKESYKEHKDTTLKIFPKFNRLPERVQIELVQLTYRGDVSSNYDWVKEFNKGNYKEAEKNFRDHNEWKDYLKTGNSKHIVDRLEAGALAIRSLQE